MIIPLQFTILEVWGKDAETYLNNRLTGVVNSQDVFMPNFALSPNGKIEGFYRVIKKGDRFFVTVETTDPEESVDQLFRFKVTERIEFNIKENCSIIHVLGSASSAPDHLKQGAEIVGESLRCDEWGTDFVFLDKSVDIKVDDAKINEFETRRILANQPLFFVEVPKGTSFVELTCEFYKPKAGICYIGQEVVEKTLAVGKPPALIVPFVAQDSAHDDIQAGASIVEMPSGKIVGSVLCIRNGCGFARLRSHTQSVGILSGDNIISIKIISKKENSGPHHKS